MAQSKNRKPAPHHIDFIPHKKKKRSAVPVAVVFCGLLVMGIVWFAAQPSLPVLIVGAAVGALVGFFAGKQMDETFNKK